jgi:hypothetical protein
VAARDGYEDEPCANCVSVRQVRDELVVVFREEVPASYRCEEVCGSMSGVGGRQKRGRILVGESACSPLHHRCLLGAKCRVPGVGEANLRLVLSSILVPEVSLRRMCGRSGRAVPLFNGCDASCLETVDHEVCTQVQELDASDRKKRYKEVERVILIQLDVYKGKKGSGPGPKLADSSVYEPTWLGMVP